MTALSDFRDLMDLWDEAADQMAQDQIKTMLEDGDLVLFFKKDDSLYGAQEGARVVFATMKHPDEDTPKNWAKDANFVALDLSKAVEGLLVKRMFGYKDINKIDVLEKEDVYKELVKKSEKVGNKVGLAKVIKELPDEDEPPSRKTPPDNMGNIGEK